MPLRRSVEVLKWVRLAKRGGALNVQLSMAIGDHEHEQEVVTTGVANPSVIDLFGHDQKTDEVLLAMHESRPWDDSDERLHELQEKFNAYVSFLLDGEMIAAHPELAGKPARIEVRCDYMPDERALGLLNLIHDQIALQEIEMEVIVAERGCGDGCSCMEPVRPRAGE
jgi:hypothetical protein